MAFCNEFCVPEWSKDPPRRRRVCHPKTVNAACGRDTLRPLRLPTRREIRAAVFRGAWVCCLDAASFFDQFPLSDEVGRYFCFRGRSGRSFRLSAMAMGQRQSTEVATALMRLACSFVHDVRIDIATDNVRFIGSRQGVIDAVTEFCARCDRLGLILNELPRQPTAAQVDAVVVQEADFLGEVMDYHNKTVRIRKKIIDRIEELWSLRGRWTVRQYAGIMASLLWVSAPLRVDIADMFNAMAFLRLQGRRMFDEPDQWDATVTVPAAAMKELETWTSIALRNLPTPVDSDPGPHQLTIFTDASAWGWGAAVSNAETVKLVQHAWGDSLASKDRSTVAEPEAIWRALCQFVRPSEQITVRVCTDHEAFVKAFTRGYSASASYNGVIARIRDRFPKLTLVLKHIPGDSNPVDSLSRGPVTPEARSRAWRGVVGS